MRNTSSASRGGSGELTKLVPSVRRGKRRARIGVGALLTALLMATQMAAPALAEEGGSSPSVECGEGVLYNKFQWNDDGNSGFTESGSNLPDEEFVITVSDNGDGTFHYELTDDDYVITKIVLKIGEGGGATPPAPIEDPEPEGDLPIPEKLSHVTFCLDDAPEEPPTPPTVTASIVCTANPETGVATYTLDVDAPEGVTTDPADGAVVSNEATEVTVNWEGDPFTVTAQPTEDCSFTPEEPPTPPTVSASIVCTADEETGEATYTLDVDAPEGVTTDPADGTTVDNVDTTVDVTWEGGTFEVVAEATEDCSFEPAGSEVLPRRVERKSTVEGKVLAKTGSSGIGSFALAGIAILLAGFVMIGAAGWNGSPASASAMSDAAFLIFDQAHRETVPARSSRRRLGSSSPLRRLWRRRT